MIRVIVDPANPGQFFACCGLLELADRLWPEVEGCFEPGVFCIRSPRPAENFSLIELLEQLCKCELLNTMTPEQVTRFKTLSAMKAKDREKIAGLDDEKDSLEKMLRENPLLLGAPFCLRLDWFQDDRAGGSRYKTWAGRQSVLDIGTAMKQGLPHGDKLSQSPERCLHHTLGGGGLPFNFDADLGGQGSAIDIGFSFDPLASSAHTRIEPSARPALEFLAFVGLQRFRPRQLGNDNRFMYRAWRQPLSLQIAAPTACDLVPGMGGTAHEFRLLYRTKYLKSFLPAIPHLGGSDE